MSEPLDIRRLTYAALPQVIAIERRAFPTPWSLAMFVLELSKPSGICLAARRDDGRMCGYLVCSRYDTVWHIMNVAVDPDLRRRGIATALLSHVLERVHPDAQLTLEVRRSNAGASAGALVTPMRRPVNVPGPVPTASTSRSP